MSDSLSLSPIPADYGYSVQQGGWSNGLPHRAWGKQSLCAQSCLPATVQDEIFTSFFINASIDLVDTASSTHCTVT